MMTLKQLSHLFPKRYKILEVAFVFIRFLLCHTNAMFSIIRIATLTD